MERVLYKNKLLNKVCSDGVSNNICEYIMCDRCSTVINAIQNHNSYRGCSTVNISKDTLDEDLDMFVFNEMNKILTVEGLDNFLYTGYDDGDDNDFTFEYDYLSKDYMISDNIESLTYEALNDN